MKYQIGTIVYLRSDKYGPECYGVIYDIEELEGKPLYSIFWFDGMYSGEDEFSIITITG